MAETSRCLTDETVFLFVEGELDNLLSERIVEHAKTCRECWRRVLDATDLRNKSRALARSPERERDVERVERWMKTVSQTLAEQDTRTP